MTSALTRTSDRENLEGGGRPLTELPYDTEVVDDALHAARTANGVSQLAAAAADASTEQHI